MNAADAPEVGHVPAQPVNRSSGLRKMPSPVPVSPDSYPMTPPPEWWGC